MNSSARVFAVVLTALAAYGLVVHASWSLGVAPPGLLRPLIFAVALTVLATILLRASRSSQTGRDPGGLVLVVLAFAVVLAPIVYALLTSGPREWDGFAAWEFRARHLADAPGLLGPFFTDLGVYSPARGYPLLQPLVLADAIRVVGLPAARLVFPLLFLVLLLGVHGLLAQVLSPRRALVAVLAVGLMPFWIGTGAGNVDSGYAELAVTCALVAVCAGLTASGDGSNANDRSLRDLLFASGLVVLPMLKPEGVLYGLFALAAGIGFVRRGRFVFGACAFGLGAAMAALVRARLLGTSPGVALAVLALPALLGIAYFGFECFERRIAVEARSRRSRLLSIVVLVVGAVLAAWLSVRLGGPLGEVLGDGTGGSGFQRLAARIRQLPELVFGVAESMVFVRKFALLWPLLILAIFLGRTTSDRGRSDRALLRFVALGLAACLGALLLVPEADLGHEFRSRFDRLLLQWSTPAWLFVLPRILKRGANPPGSASSSSPRHAGRASAESRPGTI